MSWIRVALIAAVLAALVAAGAAARSHWIGVGEAKVQTRWDAQKAVDQAEGLSRERARNADQLIRFKNAERNTDEQARRDALRAGRDARAATELRGLHATIAALDRRELPSTCDAACAAALAREAATGRELLGRCATRYQTVAAGADELRDQVTGLQADALTVCRVPTPAPRDATSANLP